MVSLQLLPLSQKMGETLNASKYFVSATDKKGNSVPFSEVTVSGDVDLTTPGDYQLFYSYDGVTESATVTVDLSSIVVKASSLYGDENYSAQNNFVSMTDKNGNSVSGGYQTSVTWTPSDQYDSKNGFTPTTPWFGGGSGRVTFTYGGVQVSAAITVNSAFRFASTSSTSLSVKAGQFSSANALAEYMFQQKGVSFYHRDQRVTLSWGSNVNVARGLDPNTPGTYSNIQYNFNISTGYTFQTGLQNKTIIVE